MREKECEVWRSFLLDLQENENRDGESTRRIICELKRVV